jgi:signal transduction histidine kinase
VQKDADYFAWVSLGYIYGIPFIPISTYFFSSHLFEENKSPRLIKLGYLWAITASLPMIFFSDKLSNVLNIYPWGRYAFWNRSIIGITYFSYLIIPFTFYTGLSFRNFYLYWKNAQDKHQKNQALYLLVGFFIAYTGSVDFLTAHGVNIYPFGYLSITLFTGITFYTIVKHQLLEIKLAFKRITLLILIYIVLLLISLSLLFPFFKNLLAESKMNPVYILMGTGTAMGLVFSFGPIIYAYLVKHSYWLRGHSTAGLTHELKSPLSVIDSAAAVALESLQGDPLNRGKISEYLTIIHNNTARLQNTVNDLLLVANDSEENITLEKTPTSINNLIAGVVQQYKPLAESKGLNLVFASDDDYSINVDPSKIRQVISNLVSNAIKFSNSGEIQITLQRKTKDILCSVHDSGIGISEKNLTRIFDKFFQATSGSKGSGIGLTIAKAWVEAHGGKIWAESAGEGEGTTFHFSLSISQVNNSVDKNLQ